MFCSTSHQRVLVHCDATAFGLDPRMHRAGCEAYRQDHACWVSVTNIFARQLPTIPPADTLQTACADTRHTLALPG